MTARMTTAQRRLADKMLAGQQLVQSFDVWGGYWWWLRPSNERVRTVTAVAMWTAGFIVAGTRERIHSGYHETIHTLNGVDA